MTLTHLLLFLRQTLLDALANNNRDKLYDLKITFSSLVEAAYNTQNDTLVGLLVALEDVARDGGMGVVWKSDVPSAEDILRITKESVA